MTRVFATKVWSLGSETWGALGFSKEGVRNDLAGEFKPDDFVVYIGTLGSDTAETDQGRLLGLVKVDSTHVRTSDLVHPDVWKKHLDGNDGVPKWPFGLPLIEVWRFVDDPLPDELDVVPRLRADGLSMKLATNYEQLTPDEAKRVLALRRERINNIYTNAAIESARTRHEIRSGLNGAGRGPMPTVGKREIEYSVKPSFTYCMELVGPAALQAAGLASDVMDKRRVYKVGWSVDYKSRQKALNFPMPNPSLLGWESIVAQSRNSQLDAYKLEQAVLKALKSRLLPGRNEMVFCSKSEIEKAFYTSTSSLKPSTEKDSEEFVLGLMRGNQDSLQ